MFLKKIENYIYNKIYKTNICSLQASLHAQYAKGVGIAFGTHVCPDVCIGYMSYVNANSYIENCEIGNYCSISDHVTICPAEHSLNKILSHPVVGNRPSERVFIGHDVLISHGATILQGVKIGDGAVIAAGAVVTKDVEPYTIWGGVPAKEIKKRFSEKQIEEIKSLEVYEMDIDTLKELLNSKMFEDGVWSRKV